MPEMRDVKKIDYEQLALSELESAAASSDIERRRGHLDQAGVFATLGERSRNVTPSAV
jgi:hypothetical protein